MIARATVILFLILLNSPAALADQWWDGFAPLGFSGRVADVQVMGSDILACGMITANGYTYTPSIAVWDGSAWQALAFQPPFRDLTHLAIIDGMVVSNGVNPSWIPDGPYRWTGDHWEVMGSGLSGGYLNRIECSTTYAGQAVVGGFFGGLVAFWDGTDWVTDTLSAAGVVLDLEVYDGDLYAAGNISLQDSPEAGGLARWNGEFWEAVTALDPVTWSSQSGFNLDGDSGWTTSLAVHDGKLVITGNFNQIGTMASSNVVTLNAATGMWGQLAALDDVPNSLAVYQGDLYAGGPSHMIPGPDGPGSLGRLAGGSWIEAGGSPHGTVDALTATENSLLISGLFDGAGGLPCGNFITWDGSSYSDLANPGGLGLNGQVNDLEIYGGELLAGGSFSRAGTEAALGLVKWDGLQWTDFAGGGFSGSLYSLHANGSDLYTAGVFTMQEDQSISQVAHFDGAAWSGYPELLPSDPTRVATLEGDLYVGSEKSYRDDQNYLRRGYLAQWTGNQWDLIITDAVVRDLVEFDGALWVGVDYFELNGSYPELVAFDGETLTSPLPSVNYVTGLQVIGEKLYILGEYGDIQTWDGSLLEQSGPTQLVRPQGTSGFGIGSVFALHQSGDRFYIGSRGDYNGYTAWEWDPATGIAAPLDLGTNGDVYAIGQLGDSLFLGGRFTLAGIPNALNFNAVGNPVPSAGIARWDFAVSSVEPLPALSGRPGLDNHPNPFNPSTTISFNLPQAAADCRLEIFDVRGRLTRTFELGGRDAGPGSVVWDGRNGQGQSVASGVYFSRLEADDLVVTRPMTLIK